MLLPGLINRIVHGRSEKKTRRSSRRARIGIIISLIFVLLFSFTGLNMIARPALALSLVEPPPTINSAFPTVNPGHRYARALLDNSMRYLAPDSGTTDVSSGYPVEGWNYQSDKGLGLRSFTQLTAIGEWTELLANVVAGKADTPYLSREQALERLQKIAGSLLQDQKDPQAGSKGLLSAFLNLEPGRRVGPLAWMVDRQRFLKTFGEDQGGAIWDALIAKGWLKPQSNGHEATILRNDNYGAAFFDGPLAPWADSATRDRIMALLDRRTVAIVFGDNVNLSTSIATAIGALMSPGICDKPEVRQARQDLENFLDNQKDGYSFLYDADTGLFFFGYDVTRNRYLGWQDGDGKLRPGHMDYMVNEFRGPTAFAIMRYGLPTSAFAGLGFTMKSYRPENGRDLYVLAPWEGSAFQALGLGLSVANGGYKSWHILLKHIVDAEIDYARRHRLPGFLSESYTGEGGPYTGAVGIPDIAVTTSPRITTTASLYTLGVAYAVAPDEVENFLSSNWATISGLLTDHGPWEGFDATKQEPVRVQTTAHTLSLILGLLGTGPENMMRYLDSRGLHPRLEEIYRSGENNDLLSSENRHFAWDTGGSSLQSESGPGGFHVKGSKIKQLGMAFVSPRKEGMNLSNGLLSFRYRSSRPIEQAKIQLKRAGTGTEAESHLPIEINTRLDQTNGSEREIQITLPATVGLSRIKEVVIECSPAGPDGSVNLSITHFAFSSYGS